MIRIKYIHIRKYVYKTTYINIHIETYTGYVNVDK